MKQYLIAPSILSADLARLGEDVERVLAAGADVIHFDVMDNHYVTSRCNARQPIYLDEHDFALCIDNQPDSVKRQDLTEYCSELL